MSQTEVQLIKDAVIVNADVSNSAAIDVSKLSGVLPLAGGTLTGDITIPDKIIHSGDTNTAIRFPQNDTVTIETGGTERLRVDSTGKVAIGSEGSPSQLLQISGDSGDATLSLLRTNAASNDNAYGHLFFENSSDVTLASISGRRESQSDDAYLAFSTQATGGSNTEKMRIKSAGMVCIGSTGYGGGGNDPILYLRSTSGRQVKIHSTASGTCGIQLSNNTTGEGEDAGLHLAVLGSGDGFFSTPHNKALRFSTQNTERLRISGSGKIAIAGDTTIADYTAAVTDVPIYMQISSNITAVDTAEGAANTGLVRLHENSSNTDRFHGIELRNRQGGDIRILNQDRNTSDKADLVIAMPTTDTSAGLAEKLRFSSIYDSIQIAGGNGAVLHSGGSLGDNVQQTEIYIATKTALTNATTNAGSAIAGGIIRYHDLGSNDNRFHGIELRNRNSGDVRILNAGLGQDNKADLAIVCDNGSNTFENARFLNTGGISFNGDTAEANGLEDYEEGTWTPQFMIANSESGVSYSNRAGTYTKIGREVTVNLMVELSNNGSNNGQVEFGGLPYTIAASLSFTSHEASGSVGYMVNMNDSVYFLSVSALENSTRLMLMGQISHDTAFDHIQRSSTANNFSVRASLTYFTA